MGVKPDKEPRRMVSSNFYIPKKTELPVAQKKWETFDIERMYSSTQVQEILNISRTTFYRWLDEGKIKAHKIGDRWKITETEVKRLLYSGGHTYVPEDNH